VAEVRRLPPFRRRRVPPPELVTLAFFASATGVLLLSHA